MMTEGKIVSWVKAKGDKLSKGESIIIIKSDKANMDIETFYDGYLAAIMVEEGIVTIVNSTIALLAEIEDEIPIARSQAASSSATMASSRPTTTPSIAETPSPPSPLENAPEALSFSPPPPNFSPMVASSAHPASEGGQRTIATPNAKKLAKDLKVELGSIATSRPMGRIIVKDVEVAYGNGGSNFCGSNMNRSNFVIHGPWSKYFK
ncbi:putative Dihydrolipoyllysine-residue acetyltransferase component 5 of pyruvate dehydrogenase complex, chloroplastic [Cocos nucifera]|uniref:Putative Dihydrolipoyllysine-residue acetyltransferase component 5 of pyruvate dehydrogenase complex, chloroplastic n=1 Tax=Cocos nucifera TaxID=13894 RepID=A0A8K0I251_COCNU|nr:putative Dihydrolipoyllysine-residue acetyltransferase component 5 of pyruvate dehydrogenase complex, chloroplastic [Cocos nucifera]